MVCFASSLTSSISSSVIRTYLPLLDLVALDDVVGLDRADARHDLLVADAFAARLVDLVEADPGGALGRRKNLDGDGDQRQSDLALPIRTRGHSSVPLRDPGWTVIGLERGPKRRVPAADRHNTPPAG